MGAPCPYRATGHPGDSKQAMTDANSTRPTKPVGWPGEWSLPLRHHNRALPASTKQVRVSFLPQIAFAASAQLCRALGQECQDSESITAFIIRSYSILNRGSRPKCAGVGLSVTLGAGRRWLKSSLLIDRKGTSFAWLHAHRTRRTSPHGSLIVYPIRCTARPMSGSEG